MEESLAQAQIDVSKLTRIWSSIPFDEKCNIEKIESKHININLLITSSVIDFSNLPASIQFEQFAKKIIQLQYLIRR